MQLSSRRLTVLAAPALLALAFSILAPTAPAFANQLYWLSAAGGSALDASNWFDNDTFTYHVPGPTDYAVINVAGGFSINWGSPVDSIAGFNLIMGRPRLNIAGTLGSRLNLGVNLDSLTLLSGTLRANYLSVGWSAPATFFGTGASQLMLTDSIQANRWGAGGRARITLNGGGRIKSNSWIEMAHGLGDVCTTTVIGRQFTPFLAYSGLTTLSAAGGSGRGDVVVGTNGSALLQLQNGGYADIAGDLFVGKGSFGQGVVHLHNTSGVTLAPSLTVHGETVVGNTDPVGYPSGFGQVLVEKGSVSMTGPCLVQSGTITIRNGASLTAGNVGMIWSLNNPSGAGLNVIGSGSHATITSSLQAGSPGMPTNVIYTALIVDSSATLNYTGSSPLAVYENASFWVGGGATIQSAADVDMWGGGQVNCLLIAPRLHVRHIGSTWSELTTYSNAVIKARMLIDPGATLYLGGPGFLVTLGDSTATDGFVSDGYTSVDRDTVLILDRDVADLGDMAITGTLRVPSAGRIASGHILVAYGGRFEGNLTNEGTISIPATFTLEVAGNLTQLTGLTIGAGTLSIPNGSALSAHGSIDPLIVLGGLLDFGPNPSLLSAGHGIQAAGTASMQFRLGSKVSGIQDALFVTGTATLGGKLDVRSVLNNLMSPGDTITIITAGAISGTFSSVKYNGGGPAGAISVLYGPTSVRIVAINPLLAADGGDAPGQPLRFTMAGTLNAPAMALDLPAAANVKVALYDVAGRQVAVLADGMLAAGRHQMALANTGVASGVYFGRAVVTGASGTRALTARVVVLR